MFFLRQYITGFATADTQRSACKPNHPPHSVPNAGEEAGLGITLELKLPAVTKDNPVVLAIARLIHDNCDRTIRKFTA